MHDLEGVDAIILGAPEWYFDVLLDRYGDAWCALKMPKVAWYAESAHRDDREFEFDVFRLFADLNYYPASQDAAEFGGRWLPFGVDETMFRPLLTEKQHAVAFVGSLYPKRMEFLRSIDFPISILGQQGHHNVIESFCNLAALYRSIGIVLNLPALSRLLVTRVTEVMACRTMLVTPKMDHPSAVENTSQFVDGRHLVYYDPGRPQEVREIVSYFANHLAERDAIAEAGSREVHENHTMSIRLEQIMADVEALRCSHK
ncbi:MAG: glycosyltransferase [Proteobacteria bacterium]|nr:glycosyltransferase [Pseudomonadota bacterium]